MLLYFFSPFVSRSYLGDKICGKDSRFAIYLVSMITGTPEYDLKVSYYRIGCMGAIVCFLSFVYVDKRYGVYLARPSQKLRVID